MASIGFFSLSSLDGLNCNVTRLAQCPAVCSIVHGSLSGSPETVQYGAYTRRMMSCRRSTVRRFNTNGSRRAPSSASDSLVVSDSPPRDGAGSNVYVSSCFS